MTDIRWVREAQVGAAREFGARHYRLIGALAVLRVCRRPIAVLAAVGMLAAAGWYWWPAATAAGTAVTGWWSAWGVTTLATAVVIVAAVVAGVFAWRRWGWILVDDFDRPAVRAAVGGTAAVLLVVAVAAVWHVAG